jgi:hypothetical protein
MTNKSVRSLAMMFLNDITLFCVLIEADIEQKWQENSTNKEILKSQTKLILPDETLGSIFRMMLAQT